MVGLKLNLENSEIEMEKIIEYSKEVKKIHKELHDKKDDEDEFLGWLELPSKYNKKEFKKIKECAKKIQKDSDILLVIGIGGSYLGARAVIEALTNTFYNMQEKGVRTTPQIIYVGNNLSPSYINDVIDLLSGKDFSINVISKSGTTTEPAIAFRIFRELIESKYGLEEARKRIYVTTDKKEGALKKLATKEKYETFVIPDNIGGRYSVLTPVGLLPIAVAGIDIDELMKGARFAQDKYNDNNIEYNEAYQYAVARNLLYKDGKNIEILANYEPKMHYVTEWWKQLYGERAKEKIKKEFSLRERTLPRICTHWDNISKRAEEIYLKRL